MDRTTSFIVLELPLLMLGAGVIGTIVWSRNGTAVSALGRASPLAGKLTLAAGMLALWVVLTAASMWLGVLYGLFMCNLLLFWLGRVAAGLGLFLVALGIIAIPFAWGWALLRPATRH